MDEWLISTIFSVVSLVALIVFVVLTKIKKFSGMGSKIGICLLVVALIISVVALGVSLSGDYGETKDMYNYYIHSVKEYEEQLDGYSQSPYVDDVTEKIEDKLDEAEEKLSEYKEQYRNYNSIILFLRATTIILWLAAIGYKSYFILNKHNKENYRFKD